MVPAEWPDARLSRSGEAHLAKTHFLAAPVTLEFPDGSTFEIELAPQLPPALTDPVDEAVLRDFAEWLPVVAFDESQRDVPLVRRLTLLD